MAALTDILVSVEDGYLDRMAEVVASLRAAGMRVDRSMSLLGTIAGAVEPGKIQILSRVEGVSGVEQSRVVAKA